MNNKLSLTVFLFIVLIYLLGCDDTSLTNPIDDIIIPSENVSYNEYIQPIFNYKCNNSGCHNSQDVAGGIDLTTWNGTVADPSVVFPFQPENSRLVWAIEGNGAKLMPPIGAPVTPLTQNQIDGIKTWIKEGADNN